MFRIRIHWTPDPDPSYFLTLSLERKKNLLSKYRILDYWSPTLRFRIRSNSSIRNFRPIPCFVNLTFSYGSNNITETFIKFHNFLGTGIIHISKICMVWWLILDAVARWQRNWLLRQKSKNPIRHLISHNDPGRAAGSLCNTVKLSG